MAKTAYWLNTAWMLSCAREAYAFRRAAGKIRSTQEQILFRILRDNQATWYGRQYRFDAIRSVQDFQQFVPQVGYEQLRGAIDRIACGESAVLTQDPITLLEPTGGSSHAEKLIPYNASLQREFQRAISAWVFNLMHRLPAARSGRAYWSISPLSQAARLSSGGIPIGFEDDRDYLSAWQRRAISHLMVMPSEVRQLQSIDNARYVTLLHLLASADLSLISVWSPTYLTSLLADLPKRWKAICGDLQNGRIRLPYPQCESKLSPLRFRSDPRRADQLQAILSSCSGTATALSECWPRLALISCWGDATSAVYLPQVQSQFPHAVIQPKGLLATEGVVSIPMFSVPGSVLAIRSHFLEFAEVSEGGEVGSGTIYLADQLELGRRYRVMLTTSGGLYRYDLGDEIEVIGFFDQCPSIRLLGRGHLVSDLVGEKLHEQFVRCALENLVKQFDLNVRFAMVAPLVKPLSRYRLYIELEAEDSRAADNIEKRLEELLRENPHYRIAVAASQLQEIDVKFLSGDGWKIYEDTCINRGQNMGDIKPVALDPWTGWDEAFSDRQSD